MTIFQRGPPTRTSNVGVVGKNHDFFNQYLASSRVLNGPTANCYTHSCARPWQVGEIHRGSNKRCRLFVAEMDDEVFMTTLCRIQQNRI